MPTLEEIDAARTPAGGWTREQLAEWGVPWPPPKGWRKRLAAGIPEHPDAGQEGSGDASETLF
ncbi:hypothetical protein ACFO4E_01795 [Nocardiopsis mangrovi]|uniref:Uncharacterized protein n=1 Tax=Nocardiopsis mangrovi TaxID=1179818 RepID=A0ABV9DNS8_9ACTN